MSTSSQASPPKQSAKPCATFHDDRAVLAIAGPEARHFLHNLLTANIEALKVGSGTLAALLTPQGKIIADMLVFDASDDEPLFLIDLLRGMADDIARRLTLYRLRAKATITLLGADVLVASVFDAPEIETEAVYTFKDPRHDQLGQRLIGPKSALEAAIGAIPMRGAEVFHARRVALGIPEGGKDYLLGDAFAHEALLDQLGGVDFKKGCYIGQEIVSRMEHRGMARSRALPVRFENGFGVTGGAELRAGDKIIGRLGESYAGRAIAILRLDRLEEAYLAGDALTGGNVPLVVEIPDFVRFSVPKAP